jgi:hypothetical protein
VADVLWIIALVALAASLVVGVLWFAFVVILWVAGVTMGAARGAWRAITRKDGP